MLRLNKFPSCSPYMGSFWGTQPVDRGSPDGIITTSSTGTPSRISLPEGFSWAEITDISAIISFLGEFYVEDVTSSYRLTYSSDFFEFLFAHPRHRPEYSLGLSYQGTLVGYVLAREHTLSLRGRPYSIVSVNFLCLSKENRSKNLAPLMIREITRIANANGIHQAIFTAEKDHGFSILGARYYHYPLNGTVLARGGIIDRADETIPVPVCRPETKVATECTAVRALYERMSEQYVVHEIFGTEDFLQTFQGRDGVLQTIYNDTTREFASFYSVSTKCLAQNISIRRSYLYYWSGSEEIIRDAIAVSHSQGTDMFDILDIAGNHMLIERLPLLEGTGTLQYHFFNIKEEAIESDKLNFILF